MHFSVKASIQLNWLQERTVSADGMGCVVVDVDRAVHGMAGPLLHGSAVDLLLVMLLT